MSKKNGSKPAPVVVGMKTLTLRGQAVSSGPRQVHTPIAARKKRVFTEDEWKFLHTLPTEELYRRIFQGDQLIQLLKNPSLLNMTPKKAAMVSSNLRFQQDAIREIIKSRGTTPKE